MDVNFTQYDFTDLVSSRHFGLCEYRELKVWQTGLEEDQKLFLPVALVFCDLEDLVATPPIRQDCQ